jgi:transcriptional regulator with XRE-family HTH domain
MSTEESMFEDVGSDGKPGVIGQNLRRLLDEKGLGVNDLARLAGDKPQKITELLSGRSRDARVETLQSLARALDVAPEDLTLTKAELAEADRLIAAFAKSSEAARLIPPYSTTDASRLRTRRSALIRPEKFNDRAIRLLVRLLRAMNREDDFSD